MAHHTFRPEYLTKQIFYCIHADCPRSATCLRQLAFEASSRFIAGDFIDPRLPQGEACKYYLSNEPLRFARGFQRGVSRLAHGDYLDFRSDLRDVLGLSRTGYYRFFSGTKRIDPTTQAKIRELFAEYGITDGEVFDAYEEGYFLG